MSVLEAHNVSIRYLKGNFQNIGLKDYIMRKITGTYHVESFWADRDINFSLEKGDMLGIIGTNGAGKSTLLKAVSGVMEPSIGYISHTGTISSLLELGGGFDDNPTIRENTFLRGAFLGYTRQFLTEKYDEIIDFSGLGEFQDYLFSELSSGMKARLAFSIASQLQPDILILDEVLSVGDGAFQKKSEERMMEIIHSGATTILVSHNLAQVRSLCSKVLWLHRGRQIAFTDDVQSACDQYQAFLNGAVPEPVFKAVDQSLS